jgi:hypothetical protein
LGDFVEVYTICAALHSEVSVLGFGGGGPDEVGVAVAGSGGEGEEGDGEGTIARYCKYSETGYASA